MFGCLKIGVMKIGVSVESWGQVLKYQVEPGSHPPDPTSRVRAKPDGSGWPPRRRPKPGRCYPDLAAKPCVT